MMEPARRTIFVVFLFLSFCYKATAQCPGEIWTAYCESNGGLVECPIGIGDKVINDTSVVNEINGPCTEGEDFGFAFNSNILWVENGCVAQFAVCMVEGCAYGKASVSCDSWDFQFLNCSVNVSGHQTVVGWNYTVKDSESECNSYNYSLPPLNYPQNMATPGIFGWEFASLWVDSGCRADFEGCFSDFICAGELVFVHCHGPGYQACAVGAGNKIIASAELAPKESIEPCDYFDGNYLDAGRWGAYGYYKNILWVANGCGARFAVCLVPGCPGKEISINCSSWDYAYEECPVPIHGQIIYATLENLYSNATCLYQGNALGPSDGTLGEYGWYDHHILWVDRGCRGEFNICYLDPCIIHGDPHIDTNDGKKYTYGGNLTYYMIYDPTNEVNITANFFRCMPHRPRVSCLYSLIIYYKDYVIELVRGGSVYVDGAPVDPPYDSQDGYILIYESVLPSHPDFIVVWIDIGVKIYWDKKRSAMIFLYYHFLGDTKGLCGTFDLNVRNDFMLRSGDVIGNKALFAQDWEYELV